jgi:hypothetical protein
MKDTCFHVGLPSLVFVSVILSTYDVLMQTLHMTSEFSFEVSAYMPSPQRALYLNYNVYLKSAIILCIYLFTFKNLSLHLYSI